MAVRNTKTGVETCGGDRSSANEPEKLDGDVLRLVESAQSRAELNVLVLLGHNPTTCDDELGFALRLRYPVQEVRQALASLRDRGVLDCSPAHGQSAGPSYWLSGDGETEQALSQFMAVYNSGPSVRSQLFRRLSS